MKLQLILLNVHTQLQRVSQPTREEYSALYPLQNLSKLDSSVEFVEYVDDFLNSIYLHRNNNHGLGECIRINYKVYNHVFI